MHLFRQQHILIIALELFLYPHQPAAEAATPEECAPRRFKEYGSMCLVTVRRSSGSRCLPACRSLICVEASPVDEPDTAKYTQTLRCAARRCIISFAFSDEKRQQSR
jgi:hypothetical protein